MALVERPRGFRERAEELERASLSTWAVLSSETKGRDRYEDPDPLRPAFQVDAHRIARSGAFRLLEGKSAWLPTAEAPSRIAVTLETARVAESIARALRLNTDLVRAIVLGHALGAAPFGPSGAGALAELGYDAAEQTVRVVERLEGSGAGLNLTWETRDGMLTTWVEREPATVEGQVARLALRIADVTLVPPSRPPRRAAERLGADPGAWADALAVDAAQSSPDLPEIRLSDAGQEVLDLLERAVGAARENPRARREHHRAVHCLQSLAIYALEHGGAAGDDGARQRVVDDLTARTERDLVAQYRAQFEPGA